MSDSGSRPERFRQYAYTWWDFTQFILALCFGVDYKPRTLSSWTAPEALDDATPHDYKLIVEEGRRQLSAQSDRFQDVQRRAQQLLTLALALVAFLVTSMGWPNGTSPESTLGAVLVILGLILGVVSGLGAAAVSVVKAEFTAIDTTQVSTYLSLGESKEVISRLALDYAGAVIRGETTVASRINHFRRSVRLVLGGAYVGILGLLL